jgi:hypothetical protein
MSAKYIPASSIIGTNLKAPNPPKEITSPSGEKYTRTYLSYDFGQPGRPVQSEALFEMQICNAKLKLNVKGKYKLNAILKNEGDLAGFGQLSYGFALIVEQYKNKFGLRNFNPSSPGDLRGAFFYPATLEGELIEGADPIVSLKLDEKKSKFSVLKPKVDLNGEPIMEEYEAINESGQMVKGSSQAYSEEKVDYKTLIDKQFDCSIIICARDLYRSTGTPLPQIFVRSCMILSAPTASGEVEHTKSAMVRNFLQQNPDAANTMNNLAEQMASLKTAPSIFDTTSTTTINISPIPVATPINVPSVSNYASSPAPVMSMPNNPMTQLNGSFPNLPLTQPGFPTQSSGIDLTNYLNQQQSTGFNYAK